MDMETNKCFRSSAALDPKKCDRMVRDVWPSGYCRYRQCGHGTSHASTHIGSNYDKIINGKTSKELKIDDDPKNGLVKGESYLSLDDENYLDYQSEVLIDNGISLEEEDDLYVFKESLREQLIQIDRSIEDVSRKFEDLHTLNRT